MKKAFLVSTLLANILMADISYSETSSVTTNYFAGHAPVINSEGSVFVDIENPVDYNEKSLVLIKNNTLTPLFTKTATESESIQFSYVLNHLDMIHLINVSTFYNSGSGNSYVSSFYVIGEDGGQSLLNSTNEGGYHTKLIKMDNDDFIYYSDKNSLSKVYSYNKATNVDKELFSDFNSYSYTLGKDGNLYTAISEYNSDTGKSNYSLYKIDENYNESILLSNMEYEFFKFRVNSDGTIYNIEELWENNVMISKVSIVDTFGNKNEIATYNNASVASIDNDESGNLFFMLHENGNFDNASLYVLQKDSTTPEKIISDLPAHTSTIIMKNNKGHIVVNTVGYGYITEENLNTIKVYSFDNPYIGATPIPMPTATPTPEPTPTSTPEPTPEIVVEPTPTPTNPYEDLLDNYQECLSEDSTVDIKTGWDLMGAGRDLNTATFSSECVKEVWLFENGEWKNFTPNSTTNFDIKKWRGFWIKGNSNCSLDIK